MCMCKQINRHICVYVYVYVYIYIYIYICICTHTKTVSIAGLGEGGPRVMGIFRGTRFRTPLIISLYVLILSSCMAYINLVESAIL